jgi:hypothetical protein
MRIRTVKPEFWTHPVMGQLEPETQLLALALLNYADDEGYFRAEASLVRSACRPFSEDSVSIHGALITLEKVGWIEVVNTGLTGVIGKIVNWEKHQRINRPTPSKLKSYLLTENSLSPHGMLTESSLLEQGTGNRKGSTPIVPLEGTGKQEDFVERECLSRVRKLFRKKENTPLDRGEDRAWRDRGTRAAVLATDRGDWELLEWFYGLPDDNRAARYRRRGMAQLLNNWNSELVRARAAAAEAGVSLGLGSDLAKKEKGPDGWRELLLSEDPELSLPEVFSEMPENLRRWAWELAKRKSNMEVAA